MAHQAQALAQALALKAQLAAQPIFSDHVKENRLTAKEGLEKVILDKNGGNWTEV
jgi:hypothetical protein